MDPTWLLSTRRVIEPVIQGLDACDPCRLTRPWPFRALLSAALDRELEVFQQLRSRAHHGVAPAEDAARRVVPRGVAAEHQIAVPERVSALREHAVAAARGMQRLQVREE